MEDTQDTEVTSKDIYQNKIANYEQIEIETTAIELLIDGEE